MRLRTARVIPIVCSVKVRPLGAITSAPAFTHRLANGMSAVITMSPDPARPAIQFVGGVHARARGHPFDHRVLRHADEARSDDRDRDMVARGDAIDLVLHRAGIGVDVDAHRAFGHRHAGSRI